MFDCVCMVQEDILNYFCAIVAFLFVSRYFVAAIYMSGLGNYSNEMFSDGRGYMGNSLLFLLFLVLLQVCYICFLQKQ